MNLFLFLQQVLGEVYDVDSKMLERMDAFEEHPDFYTRMDADVYLAPDKPNFDFESVNNIFNLNKINYL